MGHYVSVLIIAPYSLASPRYRRTVIY